MTSPSNSTGRSELTPREAEVLDLARRGYTNNEIAERLGITRNAVRFHLKEVHSKLGTGSARSVLARGWSRAIGFLAMPAAKFGVPATLATAAGSIAITGFAAYKALPADSGLAGPERFEGNVIIDGRYPNGCPAEYSASTMTLEDFAFGNTTLAELRALNPDLQLGPLPVDAIVRVPYDPDNTCTQVEGTPMARPEELTPVGHYVLSVLPADGATVTQASTRSEPPGAVSGVCVSVEFSVPAEDGRSFRLWLDSAEVTAQSTWVIPSVSRPASGRLCFAPEEGLSPGRHSARVSVANPSAVGVLFEVTWSFEVLGPP